MIHSFDAADNDDKINCKLCEQVGSLLRQSHVCIARTVIQYVIRHLLDLVLRQLCQHNGA